MCVCDSLTDNEKLSQGQKRGCMHKPLIEGVGHAFDQKAYGTGLFKRMMCPNRCLIGTEVCKLPFPEPSPETSHVPLVHLKMYCVLFFPSLF